MAGTVADAFGPFNRGASARLPSEAKSQDQSGGRIGTTAPIPSVP